MRGWSGNTTGAFEAHVCHTAARALPDELLTCARPHRRYFDPDTVGLDFKGLMEDLTAAPNGSVVLLHGARLQCCSAVLDAVCRLFAAWAADLSDIKCCVQAAHTTPRALTPPQSSGRCGGWGGCVLNNAGACKQVRHPGGTLLTAGMPAVLCPAGHC
jgi:hypothetical protein